METMFPTAARRRGVPFSMGILLLCVLPGLLFAGEITHIVKNGETAYAIARHYGVNVDDLLLLNGISDPRKIRAGQKLRVPQDSLTAAPLSSAPPRTHRVAKGETLTGIARVYGLSLSELRSLNNLSESYMLKTGDVLKLDAGDLPFPAAPPIKSADNGRAGRETAPAAKSVPVENSKPAAKSVPAEKAKPAANPAAEPLRWPFTAKESAHIAGKLSPGMLLTGEENESVRSVSSGTVVSAGPYRGFGRVVIVKSDSGYDYFYGGCQTLSVQKGDRVAPGTEVGKLGLSARTSKPQLTFMIYRNRVSLDPATTPRA